MIIRRRESVGLIWHCKIALKTLFILVVNVFVLISLCKEKYHAISLWSIYDVTLVLLRGANDFARANEWRRGANGSRILNYSWRHLWTITSIALWRHLWTSPSNMLWRHLWTTCSFKYVVTSLREDSFKYLVPSLETILSNILWLRLWTVLQVRCDFWTMIKKSRTSYQIKCDNKKGKFWLKV